MASSKAGQTIFSKIAVVEQITKEILSNWSLIYKAVGNMLYQVQVKVEDKIISG